MKPVKDCTSLCELYLSTDEDGLAPMDCDGGTMQKLINSAGGWRGLFDTGCCEWDVSAMEYKLRVIEKMKVFFECKLDRLIWLYFKDCIFDPITYYRLSGLPSAIYDYASDSNEAEKFLMLCKHPLFVHERRKLTKHWKKAVISSMTFDYSRLAELNPDSILVFR